MEETKRETSRETKRETSRETKKEKLDMANLYLSRMAAGRFPFSDRTADETSDLNDREVIRALYFVRDVVKEFAAEDKPKKQRAEQRYYPIECLDGFVYEDDKSIMTLVSQLKALASGAGVKGMSTKRILDWLKENEYLEEKADSVNGNKYTVITQKGVDAGLYSEKRRSRFGQEYEVIMYSEEAQLWLVENMREILGDGVQRPENL